MFGRSRRPKLSRQQVEAMIAAVESRGVPPAPRPVRGKPFGVAIEDLDRVTRRRRAGGGS